MILRFLCLFPAFRALERENARLRKRAAKAESDLRYEQRRADDIAAKYAAEIDEHKTDLRRIADTFSRPLTGRYTFSRVSEQETQIHAEPPQPMASRTLARDLAARKTQQFFKDLAAGKLNAGTDGTASAA